MLCILGWACCSLFIKYANISYKKNYLLCLTLVCNCEIYCFIKTLKCYQKHTRYWAYSSVVCRHNQCMRRIMYVIKNIYILIKTNS